MITPNTTQVKAMAGRKRSDDNHLPLLVKLLLLGVVVLGVAVIVLGMMA